MLHTPNDVHILTLSQLSAGQDWRVRLAHDLPQHLLIWISRGQGRVLLDGQRRGVGVHNALFVPAETLFALDLGRQSMGHAVLIPMAHHCACRRFHSICGSGMRRCRQN